MLLSSVELKSLGYKINIGESFLNDSSLFVDFNKGAAFVVTNETVYPLYGELLVESLKKIFRQVHVIQLPDGEKYKDWQSLNLIFDSMLAKECDRHTVLFALGGGVVGDMTGFAAACYMRGVPFVQIPTTLLAQVDSSVGGKTAINHPLGKNMIGAFYQPVQVIADLSTLDTLPDREFASGLAEVIKYGPIADDDFLSWIEINLDAMWLKDRTALSYAVKRCCEIKAAVVTEDEKETGLRAILNFGHTFGHAIEAGLGYGKWLHGEAVGCGMVMAAHLSCRLGLINADYVARLTALIQRARLPIRGPDLGLTRYMELMRVDKKAENGQIRFVLIESPGKAILRAVPDALVAEVIAAHTG